MCYFVVLAMDEAGAERVRAHHRLWEMPSADHAVRAVCGPGARVYSVTRDCACDVYSDPRRPSGDEEIRAESERMLRRYRRKGWSWEKASRAIEASEAKRRRHARGTSGLAPAIAQMIAEAADLLGEVGVLAFWCEPGEEKPVAPGPVVAASLIRSGEFLLVPDEVVRVVADASPRAREATPRRRRQRGA